jgi:hypothetical protein
MPQRDHDRRWPVDPHSPVDQDWQRLVEERFPADLQAQAQQLKAFQRSRGVPSALVLLRGLLYYVLSHSSLRELSAWSRLIGLTSTVISGQAWHKRLLASADWLLWLFNARLSAPKGSFRGQSQRILLVDATHVSCRDKRADTWRLHCAYDLLLGRLAWVRISTQQAGEGFAHLLLQAGAIVVGDGAYSRAKQRLSVAAAHAFALVRYSPAHLPLYASCAPAWTQEYRLDVPAWLRTPLAGSLRAQSDGRGASGLLARASARPGLAPGTSRGTPAAETAASARQRAQALRRGPLVFRASSCWRAPCPKHSGKLRSSWTSIEPDGRWRYSSSASKPCSRCTAYQLRHRTARKR